MVSKTELAKLRKFIQELPPGATVYDRVLKWLELQTLHGMMSMTEEATRRETEEWRDRVEVRAALEDYDSEQQREQFERAARKLKERFAEVGVAYHSVTAQDGDPADIKQAASELYLALENPVVQESICLAVSDEFEPLVQEWFADMRALMWGWAHVSTGIDSVFADLYLEFCPPNLQQQYEQMLEQEDN